MSKMQAKPVAGMQDNIIKARSVLYVPANKQRAIEKARSLDCDYIVFDLEDSIAPDQKLEARKMVVEALNKGGFKAKLAVRVNGLESPWAKDDILAIAKTADNFHTLVMPKIEKRQNVTDVEQLMFLAHLPNHVSLWAMIETPLAIQNLADISNAGSRLSGLVFGTNDLSSELILPKGANDRMALSTALQLVVAAGRSRGLTVIDGVYNAFKDEAGFNVECAEGAALGFDGKSLIHPNQIAGANKAFSPSKEAIAHAKDLIAAFEAGADAGLGVVQFEGEMVEALHLRAAKKIIARAK